MGTRAYPYNSLRVTSSANKSRERVEREINVGERGICKRDR
jgi:hypothetical protein